MPLDADQRRIRMPLWTALSELWLDTELQAGDLAALAEVLASSPFSIEQLREIELWEVAPVVGLNLLSPAGAWAGFDEAWLHTECEKRACRRSLALRMWVKSGLANRYRRWATQESWDRIEPQITAAREGPRA